MRHLKCSSCGTEHPAAQMFNVDGSVVCEPCGDRLVQEAQADKRKPQVFRVVDPTICTRCKTDYGNTELPLIGGSPFCHTCADLIYAYPFPAWLKAGFAALLLLLAFALYRGAPYFAAGRHLVQARRAMDNQKYDSAAIHFAAILPVKPTDQEVVLLGAKAHLMTGNIAGAQEFLTIREKYDDNALFQEVNSLWERAVKAWEKADSAGKLIQANQTAQANRLMIEAAREYPESPALAVGALLTKGGEAFDRRDYDTFLATSRQALALAPDEPRMIAGVASALACKYAVTGDVRYRTEAESLLVQAQAAAEGSAEDKASHDEYAERIRHRLATRVIIDKDEYNRRFRTKK
jgi:tetratricopeptide (TPR) repeat protein